MTIHVHIDRLVLDGLPLDPRGRRHLRSAVETELGRLLATGGVTPELMRSGVVARLPTGWTRLPDGGDPGGLGRGIARAVHGGIGQVRHPGGARDVATRGRR